MIQAAALAHLQVVYVLCSVIPHHRSPARLTERAVLDLLMRSEHASDQMSCDANWPIPIRLDCVTDGVVCAAGERTAYISHTKAFSRATLRMFARASAPSSAGNQTPGFTVPPPSCL